jgi:hypothetical protein
MPLQTSSVQEFASAVHGVPAAAEQESVASVHEPPHSPPPAHGSPACTVQAPPLQVSAPLQNKPSLQAAALLGWEHVPEPLQTSFVHTFPSVEHAVPFVLKQLSEASLHCVLHSLPPVHGLPLPTQVPLPLQVSVAVQNRPSLQLLPEPALPPLLQCPT